MPSFSFMLIAYLIVGLGCSVLGLVSAPREQIDDAPPGVEALSSALLFVLVWLSWPWWMWEWTRED